MNKVYLLLRENRESGPYTIDELIQQQLKHSDLIWTEGKSVAWCYPYEMDELKAHVAPKPKLQVVSSPNPSMDAIRPDKQRRGEVFSIPKVAASYKPDEIESKADQIRTNIISYAQQNRLPYLRSQYSEPSSGAVFTHQQGFEFVHHTRKKYVTLPQLIATGLITVLLASAWYGDWSTIRVKPNVVTVAAAPAAFNEQKPQPPVQSSAAAVADSQLVTQSASGTIPSSVSGSVNSYSGLRGNNTLETDTNTVEKSAGNTEQLTTQATVLSSTENNTAETEVKNLETAPVEIKEPKKPETKEPKKDTPDVKPAAEAAKPAVTEEPKEEKKKLGQVIKGIFKKKNKDDE